MEPRKCPRLVGALALLLAALACRTPNGPDDLAPMEVEAACGQCQFALPGGGCDLAVRIDGRAQFVRGSGIDDHGDAHGPEGLCNAVRRAEVEGRLEGEVYVASRFELLAPAN